MTSLHYIWFSKFVEHTVHAHIVELNRSYQSAKFFISQDCLDQTLRGMVENTPPPDLHAHKKSSPFWA